MNKTTRTTTINRCPNCRITVVPGGIRWNCDDYHPEVLAFIRLKKLEKYNEEMDDQADEDEEEEPKRT